MFLEVDRVEGLWSTKNRNLEGVSAENELLFLPTPRLPAHPYPQQAHTTTLGYVQPIATQHHARMAASQKQPHRSQPTPDGLRVATPPSDGGVPFPNAEATPGGIPHSAPPALPNPPQLRAKSTPPAHPEEQLWPWRAWGVARIATGSGAEQGAGGGWGHCWADASRRPPVVGAGGAEQGIWGPGASQWSMDDRSSVMSDWQRVLDWLLA
jgi:hypothetical protein